MLGYWSGSTFDVDPADGGFWGVLDQETSWHRAIFNLLMNMLIGILIEGESWLLFLGLSSVEMLREHKDIWFIFSLVVIFSFQLMDFHNISLKRITVILQIVCTEIIWWHKISFIREKQLNLFRLVIMFEPAKSEWIATLMTLQKQIRDSNNIIRSLLAWEITTCWSSSFDICFPVAFG